MDENIIVDLREARDAVYKWYGRVKAEEGQVEVASRHVFALKSVRSSRALLRNVLQPLIFDIGGLVQARDVGLMTSSPSIRDHLRHCSIEITLPLGVPG